MEHLIDIERVIERSDTLLTLPDICLQLKRIVADPASSVTDMAELIAKDPALTARLLKIVNSSLYYFPRTISSVSQAITLIGTKQLYTLALATSAAAIISTVGGSYVELKTLWKQSIYSASVARNIYSGKVKNSEIIFISGLLWNIGTLAVVKYSPDLAMSAIGYQNKNQFPWQREKEVLGFTMAEASGKLLTAWNLPDEIAIPVYHQHQPDKSTNYYLECCTLHIATRLALEMLQEEGCQILEYRNSILENTMEAMDLTLSELDTIVEKSVDELPELLQIFTL